MNMFYINHYNFGLDYGPFETLEDAKVKAIAMGFDCRIDEVTHDKVQPVSSWSPISGWRGK